MKLFDDIIHFFTKDTKRQYYLFLVILVLLTMFMMCSYTSSCFESTHDFNFHFKRFQVLMDALSAGRYPSYIDSSALDGYGYLVKLFYSDIILLPFALIGLLISPLFGYQCMIFTLTVLCGVFTYKMVNTIYKDTFAATIAAILYTFCSYRLYDLYFRAALGEVITFTFIPLVLLGLYHIMKGDYKKWYIIAIGFSLMIFSHVISTVLLFITVAIILIIYSKSLIKEPIRIKYLLLAGIVTIVITGCYIFPMAEQMLSNTFYYETTPGTRPEWNTFKGEVILDGLFKGFVRLEDYRSKGIGILLTIGICFRIFVRGRSSLLKSIDVGVIIGLCYIVATSIYVPWDRFPLSLLTFIQYPWRLHEFTSFFFAIATGYYLSQIIKSQKRTLLVSVCLILATLFLISYDSRVYKENICKEEKNMSNIYDYLGMGGLEYLPAKVPSPEYIRERKDSVITSSPLLSVKGVVRKKFDIEYHIQSEEKGTIEFPLLYYKGYVAELDGVDIPVEESDNGLLQIPVDKSGQLQIYYAGTILQKISWYISLVSMLGLCIYLFRRKSKEAKEQ